MVNKEHRQSELQEGDSTRSSHVTYVAKPDPELSVNRMSFILISIL